MENGNRDKANKTLIKTAGSIDKKVRHQLPQTNLALFAKDSKIFLLSNKIKRHTKHE